MDQQGFRSAKLSSTQAASGVPMLLDQVILLCPTASAVGTIKS